MDVGLSGSRSIGVGGSGPRHSVWVCKGPLYTGHACPRPCCGATRLCSPFAICHLGYIRPCRGGAPAAVSNRLFYPPLAVLV
jgi:hypothetical protein